MAALFNALDNYTATQLGENGHAEYMWSNNIQERIVQFSFQVTRTDDEGVKKLSIILDDLLSSLKNKINTGNLPEKQIAKGYLSVLYRMIGHTRDIVDGKGEYKLAYMMLHKWNKFYPTLAEFALRCFVTFDNKDVHQYGSWKDIKYFCEYIKNNETPNFNLIQFSVKLLNDQIRNDYTNMMSNSGNVSLAAKWAPREKSSFGWLFNELAFQYFKEYLETPRSPEQQRKAILKCKTEYRKILSGINRFIDTLQIKQCGKEWSNIDFQKVTSISMAKQKKAFLNIKMNGTPRYPDLNDRNICAANFNAHIRKAVNGEVEIKGKRVSMADFTKQALDLIHTRTETTETETQLLNSQWRDNSSQNGGLGKMIAMVDVSGSMKGDPMNVAIALGIRIAEKSVLGKRVMTFSSSPTWINLEAYSDFVSQVQVIKRAPWGTNTNFHAALNMILDAIIENKMAPEDVQDMVLVILSDMQMDYGDHCDKQVLYDTMKNKYAEAGIRVNGTPYRPPHILFWNLRSTSGFPSLSNQPNASMVSGFSPVLLNLFCEQGMESLQSITPWALLNKSLNAERYAILNEKLDQEILV